MTAEAKHLIADFGALPDAVKREVLTELLRISRSLDYPALTDDDLTRSADDIFLAYDQSESQE